MATAKKAAVSRNVARHPYVSGSVGLNAAIAHLKKSFPDRVAADTLKKLGIAPNNESYVLNTLRFLGLLDGEGNKVKEAASAFYGDDETFKEGFAALVRDAYADLFSLHGDDAWDLEVGKLTSYFRSSDHTSAIVGARQAATFQTLAGWAGHRDDSAPSKVMKTPRPASAKAPKAKAEKQAKPAERISSQQEVVRNPEKHSDAPNSGAVGLTVRVEINLPAGGDKETYDAIFKSIRENLINASTT